MREEDKKGGEEGREIGRKKEWREGWKEGGGYQVELLLSVYRVKNVEFVLVEVL